MRILPPGSVNGNSGGSSGASLNGINRIFGKPIESTFLGEASEHVLLVNGQRIRVVSTPPLFEVPEMMTAEFDPGDVVVLPE
jgi:hypothetical protein